MGVAWKARNPPDRRDHRREKLRNRGRQQQRKRNPDIAVPVLE